MASLITVRLNKGDSSSLGFRLQGGKDFGTPLVIQKVNGGSPAERAGLIAGDSVIKINNTDVFNLRHKDAQDVIVRAGPAFEVTVQRGGSTWKPSVIPTGPIHSAASTITPVTKTSLAATKSENIGAIGTGHNLSAKPFSPQLNGTVNGGPKVVNNQYNSPLKLYSEESIAETLSAQTEVLSTGALGVNFKKNEKNYDATNSAVYRMLQEAEKEPRTPEAEPDSGVVSTPVGMAGLRHVAAPIDRPAPPTQQLPPGQNICADCERLIVGVFVRIKDKNLHVECFKCSTCGTSLKNVGYYNINNKLYCDVHAKLAARSNPPAPNLVPVTVQPGGRAPANAISSALSSHSLPSPAPLSPRTNLAQPFSLPSADDNKEANISTPLQNLSITPSESNNNKFNNNLLNSTPLSFNRYLSKAGSNTTLPRPFSSVSAPVASPVYNTLPRAAPLSPVAPAPAPSYSPASSAGRSVQNIVWPPPPEEPEVPTACPLYFPPETHLRVIPKPKPIPIEDTDYYDTNCDEVEDINIMAQFQTPKLSICSEEVSGIVSNRSVVECIGTISDTLETQKLIETVMKNRPPSPPPIDQDAVIPPVKQSSETVVSSCQMTSSVECSESCELRRLTDFKPNTVECQLKSQVENAIPQKWESQMVQALRTVPPDSGEKPSDPFVQIPAKYSASALASALAIAPAVPFTAQAASLLEHVPLPEETVPYFPPEHPLIIEPKEEKPRKPESPFVKALQTAPERPFTPAEQAPVRKKKNPTDELLKDLPKPEKKLTMREALTTASDRPYTPLHMENVVKVEEKCVEETKIARQDLQRPLKPAVLPQSFQAPAKEQQLQVPRPFPIRIEEKREESHEDSKKSTTVEKHQTQSTVEEISHLDEDSAKGFYPIFKGFSCSFENKSEHSQFKIEISTTPPLINTERTTTPSVKVTRTAEESSSETVKEESHHHEKSSQQIVEKQAEEVVLKKPLPLASALHKPETLPQYQVSLSENVEADLQLMQRVEAAKLRHEQQKVSFEAQPVEIVKKPIITVQPGDSNIQPSQSFIPVREDRPASSTFSPRPRPLTPSMINRPPPTIPYYQSSLVAQQCRPPTINLLDPKSPAMSRSPSPCPDRIASPFPSTSLSVRPKSPAAGPPPNPLKSHESLPTPRDSRVEGAKKSLTTYIPQHRSKMELVERAQAIAPQIYVAQSEVQNVSQQENQQSLVSNQQQTSGTISSIKMENRQIEDQMRTQQSCQQIQGGVMSTAISEKSHLDHLEQMSKSESHIVETSGNVQIQRKKTVTEEFEHTQKAKVIQIEKNVTTSKTHPFRDVKNPVIEEQGILGLHVTNPQRLSSPFIKADSSKQLTTPSACCQKQPPPPPPQPAPQKQSVCPTKHVPAPSLTSPIKHVPAPSGSAQKPNQRVNRSNVPVPNAGTGGGRQAGAIGVAPKRGRGVLNTATLGRVPLCGSCHSQIRGPFITALGKIWCPDHFICTTPSCRRPLQDLGFVEEQGQLYCEYCFEQYLAPPCSKCGAKIKGDCLKAIGKNFHPECFNCTYCGKLFGNSPFFLEDGSPYCDTDWNELFTTKCFGCGFPVEAGDRWVEALNNNYHSQCFNCTMCKKNLEGQSFFAKGGRPFCKNHAR